MLCHEKYIFDLIYLGVTVSLRKSCRHNCVIAKIHARSGEISHTAPRNRDLPQYFRKTVRLVKSIRNTHVTPEKKQFNNLSRETFANKWFLCVTRGNLERLEKELFQPGKCFREWIFKCRVEIRKFIQIAWSDCRKLFFGNIRVKISCDSLAINY